MKRSSYFWTLGILLAALATQAFQCGSPEFTGAKVYEQQQNWKEAVRLYEAETQKNPNNAEAWFRLGRIKAEKTFDYTGMNVAFTAAAKLTDQYNRDIQVLRYNRWANHVNAGVEYLRRGTSDSSALYDQAAVELHKAAEAYPDTFITYQYIGHALLSKKDNDGAIAAYTTAWKKGKDKESYTRVGQIYVQRGLEWKAKFETDNAEALKTVRSLLEINKGAYKGEVMRMFGAPDKVKKGPKNSRREEWSYVKYGLGLTLEGEKVVEKKLDNSYAPVIDSSSAKAAVVELDKAIAVFEEIKSFDPKDNKNLSMLLQAYVEANRIKEATVAFKLAVENEPGNKLNRYILGVLYRTTGEFTAAVEQFQEALKIDPAYGEAMFDIGATYYNWGVDMLRAAQEKGDAENVEYKEKFKLALPFLEQVSELRKDDPAVWETLGTIYARLGQSEKAVKALDEADRIRRGK